MPANAAWWPRKVQTVSKDCDESLANLYLYLDAELDGATAQGIRAHLDDCPACCESFEFERRLKAVVRERLNEDVPEHLLAKLRDALQAETQL